MTRNYGVKRFLPDDEKRLAFKISGDVRHELRNEDKKKHENENALIKKYKRVEELELPESLEKELNEMKSRREQIINLTPKQEYQQVVKKISKLKKDKKILTKDKFEREKGQLEDKLQDLSGLVNDVVNSVVDDLIPVSSKSAPKSEFKRITTKSQVIPLSNGYEIVPLEYEQKEREVKRQVNSEVKRELGFNQRDLQQQSNKLKKTVTRSKKSENEPTGHYGLSLSNIRSQTNIRSQKSKLRKIPSKTPKT